MAARARPADLAPIIKASVDAHRAIPGAPRAGAELREFYARVAYSPRWLDGAGLQSRDAHDALTLLEAARDEGLDPVDYGWSELDTSARTLSSQGLRMPGDLAAFDVALSSGVLRYLRDLHLGRVDPRAIGFRLTVPRDDHDFASLLDAALARHGILEAAEGLRPPLAQYRLLRAALPRYRELARTAAFTLPPPDATAVRPGHMYSGLADLHRLLLALGDLPSTDPDPAERARYEGTLVDGVKRFQTRHGLGPDGVLGKDTLAALRVSLAWRVRQIELALERMRWLPHLGAERLLVINIPMFRLWAWDSIPPSGVPSFSMGVIVGRALSTQTPVFVEQMREVIFRPYWNVPRSILLHEILPAIERDPDYLRRQDMEIVRGDGDDARAVAFGVEAVAELRKGTLRARQRPGPKNSLGLIKFVFPNEENVYMHDTPAQALFARSRRDFSHGCVRVEAAMNLAEWVLQGQPEWDRDRILAATSKAPPTHVKLRRPIQVVLFYSTAAVMPEDGSIWFADDIYRHDARLDRALGGGRPAR